MQCLNVDAGEKDESIDNGQWSIKTTTIVGDSILNYFLERILCGQGHEVKVKCFPGLFADNLNWLYFAETNDTPNSVAREIQDNLLKLKFLVN